MFGNILHPGNRPASHVVLKSSKEFDSTSTSILHSAGLIQPRADSMFYGEEENEWDQLNKTSWNGLGLTDPVKNVEVGLSR
jgi:hypothetical protein